MAKPGDSVNVLLGRINELEKRLKVAEKASEVKKIVSEITEELPKITVFAKDALSKKGEIVSGILSNVKEHRLHLSDIVKTLEDKETTITAKFNKLTITIDGEKTFSLNLLKKHD